MVGNTLESLLTNLAELSDAGGPGKLPDGRGRLAREVLSGREYLVAPATLIVPGVLPGSKGPLYYPPEETAKNPSRWNRIPLVVYHPTHNGEHVSANHPGILDRSGVGYAASSTFNGKLRSKLYFDVAKLRAADERFGSNLYNRLVQGQPIELSTGLYTDNEPTAGISKEDGRSYEGIARNYRPDHIAILPDQVGACSINDGCGVLVNMDGTPTIPTPKPPPAPKTSSPKVKTPTAVASGSAAATRETQEYTSAVTPVENDEEEPTENREQSMSLLEKFVSWIVNAGPQPRHPKDGTFQGSPHVAAKRGFTHDTGHEQAPEEDPDDDGDEHAEIGQGDRPAVPLEGNPEKDEDKPDDPTKVGTTSNQFGADAMAMSSSPTGAAPHQATKEAAAATVHSDHAEAREPAMGAVDASKDGNAKKAASFHTKAALAHEGAATEARQDKDPMGAASHDEAAALHRKAASMHAATCNANPEGHNQYSSSAGAAQKATKAAMAATDRSGSAAAIGSTKGFEEKPSGNDKAKQHQGMANIHKEMAQSHKAYAEEAPSGSKTQLNHQKAADLHTKAAKAHTEASKLVGNSQEEPMNRSQAVAVLTANCSCAADKAALNSLSDTTLIKLAQNAKAEGSNADTIGTDTEEESGTGDELSKDDDLPEKAESQVKSKGGNKMTDNQWLASAPPSVRSAVANAIRIEQREKTGLIERLTANVADEGRKTRLVTNLSRKPLDELRDMLAMVAPTANRNEEADLLASYLGASVPYSPTGNVAATDDDLLEVTTLNYAELVAEQRQHGRERVAN